MRTHRVGNRVDRPRRPRRLQVRRRAIVHQVVQGATALLLRVGVGGLRAHHHDDRLDHRHRLRVHAARRVAVHLGETSVGLVGVQDELVYEIQGVQIELGWSQRGGSTEVLRGFR